MQIKRVRQANSLKIYIGLKKSLKIDTCTQTYCCRPLVSLILYYEQAVASKIMVLKTQFLNYKPLSPVTQMCLTFHIRYVVNSNLLKRFFKNR